MLEGEEREIFDISIALKNAQDKDFKAELDEALSQDFVVKEFLDETLASIIVDILKEEVRKGFHTTDRWTKSIATISKRVTRAIVVIEGVKLTAIEETQIDKNN